MYEKKANRQRNSIFSKYVRAQHTDAELTQRHRYCTVEVDKQKRFTLMESRATDVSKTRLRSGFTLIELLTVIMIISVLAGLLIGVIRYARFAAKRAHARAEIEELHKAILNYQLGQGHYPADLYTIRTRLQQGFLTNGTTAAAFEVLDPWLNPYRYSVLSTTAVELYSTGPELGNWPGSPFTEDDIHSGK